ncbi:MAG: PASTA domain-containing protein [Clostridiales bacterium]|jgi:serine/threonine-protein kinase|nr:PASTA domain-containing protein [Clostridiales bacterium]
MPEQPAPRRKGERTGKDDMKKSEKKTIIWAIVTSVVVVAALVIGSLAVLLPDLFKGGKTDVVTVPELTGKLYDEVKDSFAAQNISVKITQRIPDNDSAEGTVLSQEPKAGKTVKTPLEIEVTVSEGAREFTLENYALKGFIEVKLALENKEVVVLERNEENDDIAEGMIIRTTPGPNAKVKAGDSVTLYVSSGAGEKQVLMPNVVGLSLQQAKKIITDNGLLEGDAVKEVYSDKPKGEVLEQSEAANTNIKAYTKINLTVSKGQEPRSKSVGITVPQDREVTRIKIVQDGVVVHDASHNKSEGAFNFNVSGNGTVVVQVYHDGNLAQTVPVTL